MLRGVQQQWGASTHQLQASLAGEDDGRCVVPGRIGCTLGGAQVGYEDFSRCVVDLGAAGRSTDILQRRARSITGETKQVFGLKMIRT